MDIYSLGIESSCDETSASIVLNGREVLSNVISSQIDTHKLFGGVVPEIASRLHLEMINKVVDKAIKDANLSLKDIDIISVTKGPGLIGALIVGVSCAKALSLSLSKPLVGVNHIKGHIAANYLCHKDLKPPFSTLIISGGHTYLAIVKSYNDIEVVGRTLDDACGECYDKIARKVGIGYPGGPIVDRIAKEGNKKAFDFPRVMIDSKDFNFSFSGLKTAVLNFINTENMAGRQVDKKDLAASFQRAIVDVLVSKSLKLLEKTGHKEFAISGGVSANSRIRERFEEELGKRGVKLYYPNLILCTDNAAMIASSGYYEYLEDNTDELDMKVYPNLGLE